VYSFLYSLILLSTLSTCMGNHPRYWNSRYVTLIYAWLMLAGYLCQTPLSYVVSDQLCHRYALFAAIYCLVKFSHLILNTENGDIHSMLKGELFLMVVWPTCAIPALWILVCLTTSTFRNLSVGSQDHPSWRSSLFHRLYSFIARLSLISSCYPATPTWYGYTHSATSTMSASERRAKIGLRSYS
jgi:hypothetical protein